MSLEVLSRIPAARISRSGSEKFCFLRMEVSAIDFSLKRYFLRGGINIDQIYCSFMQEVHFGIGQGMNIEVYIMNDGKMNMLTYRVALVHQLNHCPRNRKFKIAKMIRKELGDDYQVIISDNSDYDDPN